MSSLRQALALLTLASACTSYQVQQSALVPPPILPAQPTSGPIADAYVGDATVTFLSRPERAPDDDSALWVSRHVLQGAGTVHFGYIGLRMTGMAGLPTGAMAAAPGSLGHPDATVGGYGMGFVAAVPIEAHLVTGTLDGSFVWIPSRYESMCVSNCEGVPMYRAGEDREVLIQPSLSLGYGYRFSPVTRVFGAFSLQDHPTNQALTNNGNGEADVQLGPMYVTVGAGVELTLLPWFSVMPLVQWPLTRSPIEYGPFVGLGVRGSVPRPQHRD